MSNQNIPRAGASFRFVNPERVLNAMEKAAGGLPRGRAGLIAALSVLRGEAVAIAHTQLKPEPEVALMILLEEIVRRGEGTVEAEEPLTVNVNSQLIDVMALGILQNFGGAPSTAKRVAAAIAFNVALWADVNGYEGWLVDLFMDEATPVLGDRMRDFLVSPDHVSAKAEAREARRPAHAPPLEIEPPPCTCGKGGGDDPPDIYHAKDCPRRDDGIPF